MNTNVLYHISASQFYRLAAGKLLDVLVNNAGMAPPEGAERVMCDHHPDWEVAMATNCLGAILLTDLLTDSLKETASEKVCRLKLV